MSNPKEEPNPTAPTDEGPYIYSNLLAFSQSKPLGGIFEFPLFTDSHITGQFDQEPPYVLCNTINAHQSPHLPSIVLRAFLYHKTGETKMDATHTDNFHGGSLQDEVAALLSLHHGIRVEAAGVSRRWDNPDSEFGQPFVFEQDELRLPWKDPKYRLRMPGAVRTVNISEGLPLRQLIQTPLPAVRVLIRAARMYQQGLLVGERDPATAWLLFVSAVETAAQYWRNTAEPSVVRFRTSRPDLSDRLEEVGGPELLQRVADEMADYVGATRKFIDFVDTFKPAPIEPRPKLGALDWSSKALVGACKKVYNWRSMALHGGTPFPWPMCERPFQDENGKCSEFPLGLAGASQGGVWLAKDTPINLHAFEYITRNCLLNWWRSTTPQPPPTQTETKPLPSGGESAGQPPQTA